MPRSLILYTLLVSSPLLLQGQPKGILEYWAYKEMDWSHVPYIGLRNGMPTIVPSIKAHFIELEELVETHDLRMITFTSDADGKSTYKYEMTGGSRLSYMSFTGSNYDRSNYISYDHNGNVVRYDKIEIRRGTDRVDTLHTSHECVYNGDNNLTIMTVVDVLQIDKTETTISPVSRKASCEINYEKDTFGIKVYVNIRDSSIPEREYTFDLQGNPLMIITSDGANRIEYEYLYNENGIAKEVFHGSDTTMVVAEYEYDNGQLIESSTLMSYPIMNSKTGKSSYTFTKRYFEYNKIGYLESIQHHQYQTTGSSTSSTSFTTEYKYNRNGLPKALITRSKDTNAVLNRYSLSYSFND